MLGSERSEWTECCQHEEQIAILQEKLIEVHNKLIDQLDICKEQELTIIQLSSQLQLQNSQTTPAFNYQSFGNQPPAQENRPPNHSAHDSAASHQTKTELLQADLEAMRSKVLNEITDKNRLKEESRELKARHRREMGEQRKKNEELELMNMKLRQELENLAVKRNSKVSKNEGEVDRLAKMLAETESRYFREKEANRALLKKLAKAEDKFSKEQSEESTPEQVTVLRGSNSSKIQSEIRLKGGMSSMPKGGTGESRVKRGENFRRQNFEETRSLIKKLEETESLMRKNRRPVT